MRSEEGTAPAIAAAEAENMVKARLFGARTVLVFGEVTMALAERVCGQLLALADQNDKPIRVIVHSPGGHVEAADAIHDVLRFVTPEIRMLGTGWVASAGALIFASAPRKNRVALRNTRFLLHQPLGGMSGPATDIEIEAAQIVAMRERLNRVFAEATGQTYEKIAADTDRNHWMTAEEAVAYGLVDRVVSAETDL